MRISFMGKGGSGKTTLTAAFTKYLAQKEKHVLAVDGDVNVHLSQALEMDELPISSKESEIFKYFEGYRDIPLIGTLPPTDKSKFVTLDPDDLFLKKYSTQKDNISLITVGTYQTEDIGFSCYHGKLGVVEMFFHHLLDTEKDFVVSDFTAGIDSLGTSMFLVSDVNVFVVEPTNKGIKVYRDFKEKSQSESLKTYVVVNKVIDKDDEKFVSQHFDIDELLGMIKQSPLLHKFERGDEKAFDAFVLENEVVFETITQKLKESTRDWDAYYNRLVEIYKTNCNEWYNDYYSQKLDDVIQENFSYEDVIKRRA